MPGKHPSHQTRFSFDASTYDEVCELCGNTDKVPGGWGKLAEPCPVVQKPAGETTMRLNVLNMLRNAALELEDADGCSAGGYGFCLRQLARHIEELAREPSRWREFAELYCLTAVDLEKRT